MQEDTAAISPPPPPPSRDHMINELMSGPDEELGMNESPSRRLSLLKHWEYPSKKRLQACCGLQNIFGSIPHLSVRSQQGAKTSLGFIMRVTIIHVHVTPRWVYAPCLDIFQKTQCWVFFFTECFFLSADQAHDGLHWAGGQWEGGGNRRKGKLTVMQTLTYFSSL